MNKGFIFLIFIISVFIAILMFDTDLKFNYVNSHNNTANVSSVPQILPSIPYQFVNIIFLIVITSIVIGVFLYIVKVYNK